MHKGKPRQVQVDASKDWLNILATSELPLKLFCKDNGLYLFGLGLTVGQQEALTQQLKQGKLTREDVLATYREHFRQEPIMSLLARACEEQPIFEKRRAVLTDAFEAHFSGKYTLSIPVLFTQLEGLLRDVGKLKNSDNVKGTIRNDIWNDRLLRPIEDDATFFNAFVHKLFEGSKGSGQGLNRNPILHGFEVDYTSADNSMLLMHSILEIRLFLWWEGRTGNFFDKIKLTIVDEKDSDSPSESALNQ
ncbi:hypothetical protein [Hymenobacter montanus]|nr:hypothetical protein [Hymenobacter montanus]